MKKFLLLLVLFFSSVFSLAAQDFYWENPATLSEHDSRFPKAVTNGIESCVVWQEVDTKKHQIWLSAVFYSDINNPVEQKRFAGPVKYSSEVPDIFAVSMRMDGTVCVALLSEVDEVSIYSTYNKGHSFSKISLRQDTPLVAPRLFVTAKNTFRLFASKSENEAFSIVTAESSAGGKWTDIKPFEPSLNFQNPFLPSMATYNDGDFVVFQAQTLNGSRMSYQLYGTYSTDQGKSWTTPVLLTDQSTVPASDTRGAPNYHNQQASLFNFNNEIYMAWERTFYLSENAQLWIQKITPEGPVKGSCEQLTTGGNASRPVLFNYANILSLVWFDTRNGNERVYLAQKNGALWDEQSLSAAREKNLFGFPLLTNRGKKLSFVWEQTSGKNYKINILKSDATVALANFTPLSYREGRRSTNKDVRIRINYPDDSSGIAGYSYSWSQDLSVVPETEVTKLPADNVLNLKADNDGDWYLKVRVFDYAGNVSNIATTVYKLDLTPPRMPGIEFLNLDDYGFSVSNALKVRIIPDAEDSDVEGYTYSLDYIGALPKNLVDNPHHPIKISPEKAVEEKTLLDTKYESLLNGSRKTPSNILSRNQDVSFDARANGVYILTVAAIDEVGNISERKSELVVLNKFIPKTYVLNVKPTKNELGELSLDVTGGGFTYDGYVEQIYIDRDGEAPYDMILYRQNGQYKIVSDNRITGIGIGNNLDEGMYRIGLLHSDRGLYFTGKVIRVEQNGTIKFEPEIKFIPDWKTYKNPYQYSVYVNYLLLAFVVLLSIGILIFACQGFISTARETVIVRKEVRALITGDVMPTEKKKRSEALKKKGVSLKLKLVGFTSTLVIAIVALVAIPLGYIMTTMQERTLGRGLQQRVEVLLESLSSGARAYMPANNILELSYLPDQAKSMDEAKYATIIGESEDGSKAGLNFIWATNDENISDKIDTETVEFGRSASIDERIESITQECSALNEKAMEAAGSITRDISELNQEGVALALNTDAASIARLEEIALITTELNGRLTTLLSQVASSGISSYPKYDATMLDSKNTDYLFYKPVLFRQGSSQNYVHGVVLVEISTQSLVDEAESSRRTVFIIAGAVAFLAVLIGAVLSFILSSIIVNPLKKLAAWVKVIGQTKDKAKLRGKDFKVTSKDEIGQLGEVINDMTGQLAKAAEDEKLSLDGKAVQNAFLPLLPGKHKTQTVAELKEKNVECFGYYEGASGVSGDYFDYRKLDDRWFAIIKCDASGHGVPAALIMTVVATLFREYFNTWSYQKNGVKLNILVTKINDALESLGLKGKFAAMLVCLMDTQTGDVYMCNAGDNIVHVYDSEEKRQKVITLTETPAAGPLPSFMVDMKGGFKVEKINLKKGDVLFMYTDGIEESTRLCRHTDFTVIVDEGKNADGNPTFEDRKEQMEPERVKDIIESVFAKQKYVLVKKDNPVPGENLEFDFTGCEGSLSDAILALASVEKVFRFYKTPDTTENDIVTVDRRIDAFLKDHFNQYSKYCGNMEETEEENYLQYTNVSEDEQLDDLTLLAVKRV